MPPYAIEKRVAQTVLLSKRLLLVGTGGPEDVREVLEKVAVER